MLSVVKALVVLTFIARVGGGARNDGSEISFFTLVFCKLKISLRT